MGETYILMDLFALQNDGTKQYLTPDREGHTSVVEEAGIFTEEEKEEIMSCCLVFDGLPQYLPMTYGVQE